MKAKTKQTAAVLSEAASVLLFAYPLGLLLGLLGLAGRMCGALRVLHPERLSCLEKLNKKILVAPHPSWIDPFLVAILIAWYYALHPLRHAPLIVADRLNFYDSWWFWPFRSVMVPVDRDSDRKKATALLRIKKAVDLGRPIVIFPEGGRTFKGKEGEFLYSQRGNKIRFLQGGIGLLVRKTEAAVIPIGIKGSDKAFPNSRERLITKFVPWKRITIAVGEPMRFDASTPRERVTQEIASTLLKLIDEASA
ncbi:MAG: lysophospholipid acyltransferase family protein [Candidatus Staskawiczbacteria bacterium]|jgi:1-acyl-sn-glycerol-3-phosphate acyltransferase